MALCPSGVKAIMQAERASPATGPDPRLQDTLAAS